MTDNDKVQNSLSADFFGAVLATPEAQNSFIDRLWPGRSDVGQIDAPVYFAFVRQERGATSPNCHAVKTYGDILLIVDYVRINQGLSLCEIVDELSEKHGVFKVRREHVISSIGLAMRLWLMLNIRSKDTYDFLSRDKMILWREDESLSLVLQSYLRLQVAQAPCDQSEMDRFQRHFNAIDLKRIGRLQVQWTSDLSAHLTIGKTNVRVFQNLSVLKRMKESPNFGLPEAYIDETIATIELILPTTNPSCFTWLTEQISKGGVDKGLALLSSPNYDKSTYRHWQARMSEIADTLENTKPSTFVQWFYDRRDPERWWQFWLILLGVFLTVLFGLIQSITGILQVARPC